MCHNGCSDLHSQPTVYKGSKVPISLPKLVFWGFVSGFGFLNNDHPNRCELGNRFCLFVFCMLQECSKILKSKRDKAPVWTPHDLKALLAFGRDSCLFFCLLSLEHIYCKKKWVYLFLIRICCTPQSTALMGTGLSNERELA